MWAYLVIGAIIATTAIVVLTVSIFVSNIKSFLEKKRLPTTGLNLAIKKRIERGDISVIKFDAIDKNNNRTILKNAEYRVDVNTEIDDTIKEGAIISI